MARDKDSEILQRNVVYFKHISEVKILPAIEKLKQDPLVARYNPRYLIVTDFNKLAAIDTKKSTTLDMKIQDIDKHIDFFMDGREMKQLTKICSQAQLKTILKQMAVIQTHF